MAASGLRRDSVVEVLQDGLAVRRGPGAAYEQVGAERIGLSVVEPAGAPYLLTVGERLVIQDGPLRIEGTDWYSVRAAGLAERGDTIFTEGWVAAGEEGAGYFAAVAASGDLYCLLAAKVGTGVTMPVPSPPPCSSPSACGRAVAWVAGLAGPEGTCQLRITQDTTGAVLVDQPIHGWARGGTWWPEQNGAAIVVETECSWSVHVGPV